VTGETSSKQRGPETIAGASEVMANGGSVESGIDAAEEHTQTRRNHVAHRLAFGCDKLLLGGLPGFSDSDIRNCD
jgi:hypothetical protein